MQFTEEMMETWESKDSFISQVQRQSFLYPIGNRLMFHDFEAEVP